MNKYVKVTLASVVKYDPKAPLHLLLHQLHGHLLPISKTIQVRQTRHVANFWGSKDKLMSDVLLWTPTRPLTSHL